MKINLAGAASDIFLKTIREIDVEKVVEAALERQGTNLRVVEEELDLAPIRRLVVIAIGKAALPMARAAGRRLGDRLTAGIVATNEEQVGAPPGFHLFTGGHPVPNQGSLDAERAALELLQRVDSPQTLVLFLISGGGSALFERPVDETITLADLQEVNRVLVGCGAVIGEMNVVRRFLSAVKGGRLAAAAPRSRQISLIISDVNHDDLTTVSSGPTLRGRVTRDDFDRIVGEYRLLESFPPRVASLIKAGRLPEMPVSGEGPPSPAYLLLDNRVALEKARRIAEDDYQCVVEIAADLVEGEVEEMAAIHLARLGALREAHPGRRVCLISGGEVICPVRGDGEGGRNQEFVLRAIRASRLAEVAILSGGTDGIDGRSPAAGAIADQSTLARATAAGLDPADYLQRSDSYNFFAQLGSAIVTGPTGNNVRDLRILLTC
ncbi:MAG: glycerate kinase [Acidobacteriota bacterium]